MQFPILLRVDFSGPDWDFLMSGDYQGKLDIQIPTTRPTSWIVWNRTNQVYQLKDSETIIALRHIENYWNKDLPFANSVVFLPLIPLLNGIIPKNAVKWKTNNCQEQLYPRLEYKSLKYLDGTPIYTQEAIQEILAEAKRKDDERRVAYRIRTQWNHGARMQVPQAAVDVNALQRAYNELPELPPIVRR